MITKKEFLKQFPIKKGGISYETPYTKFWLMDCEVEAREAGDDPEEYKYYKLFYLGEEYDKVYLDKEAYSTPEKLYDRLVEYSEMVL